MLKEQSKLIVRGHQALDIGLTATSFITAYFIKRLFLPEGWRGLTTEPNYYAILLLIIIIWFLVFDFFRLYESYRRRTYWQVFSQLVKAVSAAVLILLMTIYIVKLKDVSRILLGLFYLLNILLLGLSKGVVYRTLARFRNRGFNFRSVLIVGSKDRARDVIRTIGDRQGAGFRVLGCLDIDPARIGESVKNGCKVIGTVGDMQQILEREVVDELIFAMPLRKIDQASKYIVLAENLGVSVRIIPDWQLHHLMYRPEKAKIQFEDFLGIPTMSLETTPPDKAALMIKAAFDYAAGALMMLFFLPLFFAIALAIKIVSPAGPVFYRQERFGLQGRRFDVYKFRTMVPDAEKQRDCLDCYNEADGPVFKIRNDPRIIPWIGHFLRKTSLDELPQLINVLAGEMSLVGPRPPIPAEVDHYEIWQRRRLSMKPGLTCIWQISPNRNDVSFADWMNMDLEYIDNWSLALDFKILARTVLVVLTGHGR
ncbi:MAG: sugar transferase [Desulfobacterales bacterium]|nr:sugar transferase [Desulfobacterales bacterium]